MNVLAALAFLAVATVTAAPGAIEPSHERVKQLAYELYPAALERNDLETLFVVGVVLDPRLRVVSHSASLPPRKRTHSGAELLRQMFPKLRDECQSEGITVLRPPRGVGGQFDKGAIAVWCVQSR